MSSPTSENPVRRDIMRHLHQQYPAWAQIDQLVQTLARFPESSIHDEIAALINEELLAEFKPWLSLRTLRLTPQGLEMAAARAAERRVQVPITITSLAPCCPADGRALRLEGGRWGCSLCGHSEYAYQPPRQARLPGSLGADRRSTR